MEAPERRQILDLLELRVEVERWEPCTACKGKGKVKGGTGGLPCPTCQATRTVPHLKVSGVVYETLLDLGEPNDEDRVPFRLSVA
jgi:hypothetical protein